MTDPLFHEWRAYRKLVEHDYMDHSKFFQELLEEVKKHFSAPLAILDLGCGDSDPVLPLLRLTELDYYCGIDQSETALESADNLLSGTGLSYRLITGDFLESTRLVKRSFDLIIASFSLHHLPGTTAKLEMLQACRRILRPGGILAIIDVFLDEDESRGDYVERFERNARKNYSALNDDEMTTLITHVKSCDYPETVSSYDELGQKAGFKQARCLLGDEASMHHLICLDIR